MRMIFGFLVAAATLLAGEAALAAAAEPWQLGFQPAATPVMESINSLHNLLLVIIVAISIFVLALLLYCVVRYRESANPTPSKTSHNTLIEVIWTVVPVIILVVIAVPSFRLLYFADVIPEADMTVKVTGHQWYWNYEYPDHGEFSFDSNLIPDDEIQPGQKRLLSVDNPLVVPAGATVHVLLGAADVLHAWAIPSFGVKTDTVPGRTNNTWFRVDKEGTYYGMCSELCGVNHGYMPIEVRVVSPAAFEAWVAEAKVRYARADDAPATQVAAAPAD